jgi:hypothetical protein
MCIINLDSTHSRLTNKFHTIILVNVIRLQLCVPQDRLKMAYKGRKIVIWKIKNSRLCDGNPYVSLQGRNCTVSE